MPWELYLIENKPLAICFQIVLEFIIFLIASLLWLTWCSRHLRSNGPEAKSLAFALPGYLIGWVCLMVTRLFGSRLKEKFCFSFYLMCGVRFMSSAAILFPEFSRDWYSVAYGLISLLCFVNTIFHIVTQSNPETRPVRRLIAPDGTIMDDPAMEMMTVKQLENYRDILRTYMEKGHIAGSEMPAVRSVEVIRVSLEGSGDGVLKSTDGTSLADLVPTSRTNLRGSRMSLGGIPGTTRNWVNTHSTLRISQITIRSKSPEAQVTSSPEQETAEQRGSYIWENRGAAEPPTKSRKAAQTSQYSSKTGMPVEIKSHTKLLPDAKSKPDPYPMTQEHLLAKGTPLESNQLQRCHYEASHRREACNAQTVESIMGCVSRFWENRILDDSELDTRTAYPTVNHRVTNMAPPRIHRATCPLHKPKLSPPPDDGS